MTKNTGGIEKQPVLIKHDRRRWNVLIVASVAYLCSHSYAFGVLATSLLETIISVTIDVIRDRESGGRARVETFLASAAISIVTIAVGVTINAFAAYVFDLTFLFGLQWLYLAVVVIVYVYIRALDEITGRRVYVDYVFGIASMAMLAVMMNFVAFGEPYTFMTEMLYIASVVGLSATSSALRWWAALIFVVFWAIVILVGLAVNLSMHRDFRYPVSRYFTQTPLLD